MSANAKCWSVIIRMRDAHQAVTLNIAIACAYEQAAPFLFTPENMALWAKGLGSALKKEADGWIVQTPDGNWKIRFSPLNDFGILDHWVYPPEGEVYVPMRIVRYRGGCDVSLTLFRQDHMDDALFERDIGLGRADLHALKNYLETRLP